LSALTYDEIVRELFPRLTGGIRWGLERTQRMLASVDDPHLRYPVIHVGGTNGKGSVSATIASVLRAHGLTTGLYTSPHLCTFRERIEIGSRPVTEEAMVRAAERLWPAVRRESPSFFEATTAIAFLALADAEIDVGVIEVGLGGRLDATNVITPLVSVLTNVALDHVQLLGPTIESVAREKAGIIKPGVPVITGETGEEALAVFRATARERGAPLRVVGDDAVPFVETSLRGNDLEVITELWGRLSLASPLPGKHQARNTALAVLALEALPEALRPEAAAVEAGVAAVRLAGRLEVERAHGRTWLFDVAHNVAGAQALGDALRDLSPPAPVVALVGVLGDKDWRGMLGPIYRAADAVVLTLPPTAPSERRWDPDSVLAEAPSPHAQSIDDFGTAMSRAWSLAGPGGTIVVTGSFHTVGDALIALGMAPYGADADLPVPMFAA
jgi:dihydrofolate synthase/folylpolyglutamate synthase